MRQSSNPAAVCNLPSHDVMVANILRNYHRATKAQIHAGYAWYAEAQDFCRTLATATQYPVRTIAGVIAALSPQAAWGINKANARIAVDVHYMTGGCEYISLHTKPQMAKVSRILDGETPESVLRGPKESAFSRNIQGDYSLATVDRHAFTGAVGKPLPDVNPVTGKSLGGVGKGAYKRIHAAYVEAAAILGTPVAILQAIVWVVIRGSAI